MDADGFVLVDANGYATGKTFGLSGRTASTSGKMPARIATASDTDSMSSSGDSSLASSTTSGGENDTCGGSNAGGGDGVGAGGDGDAVNSSGSGSGDAAEGDGECGDGILAAVKNSLAGSRALGGDYFHVHFADAAAHALEQRGWGSFLADRVRPMYKSSKKRARKLARGARKRFYGGSAWSSKDAGASSPPPLLPRRRPREINWHACAVSAIVLLAAAMVTAAVYAVALKVSAAALPVTVVGPTGRTTTLTLRTYSTLAAAEARVARAIPGSSADPDAVASPETVPWRLYHEEQRLEDSSRSLESYGVRPGAELSAVAAVRVRVNIYDKATVPTGKKGSTDSGARNLPIEGAEGGHEDTYDSYGRHQLWHQGNRLNDAQILYNYCSGGGNTNDSSNSKVGGSSSASSGGTSGGGGDGGDSDEIVSCELDFASVTPVTAAGVLTVTATTLLWAGYALMFGAPLGL
ncbi:hypothetical protein JKP88DRAFT_350766 [Tribonema minus]|uniref:Ubiquitin-like domain-containing protein n=1 Tax=Tribonema minus TaxID=303371 RepID=A0A835YKX2_9STRA|nr:hypothetical protein JKP88DRAFT_350766 [Tribonema minus]